MKFIAKSILYLFLVLHLLPVVFFMMDWAGTNITYKHSYIHYIDTPKWGNERVKKSLDKFDRLGHNKLVNYEGYRPIFIVQKELGINGAGVAIPLPAFCIIGIDPSVGDNYFDQVLLHEYLHCFGYGHNFKNKYDLMAPVLSPAVTEDNVRKYAQDMLRRFHE